MYYSIYDGHGNELATGIQGDKVARKAAQAKANQLGHTVYLCDSEQPDDMEAIRPEKTKG